MGLLEFLFGTNEKEKRKFVFVSFAIEDIKYRDYLIEQARKSNSPFDFIDMSVKQKWKQSQTPIPRLFHMLWNSY